MTMIAVKDRELFGVQMLRGIAALFVVFHHALEESLAAVAGARSPDWLTLAGASGVDIFFVVSGFIMLYVSYPLGRVALAPGQFLLKRASRIYPLYWFSCLAVVAICAVGFLESKILSPSIVLMSFSLLPTPNALVGVSWTLSYEIYFYLIFAATLFWGSPGASLGVTTTAIVLLLAAAQFAPPGNFSDFLADPIAIEFCFGLMLARLFMLSERRPLVPVYWSLLGFAALIMAPLFVAYPDTHSLIGWSRIIFWGLPSIFVLAGFLWSGTPRGVVGRFAVWVGDASYAIYLTHIFVMMAYAKLLKSTALSQHTQVPVIPVVVIVSLAVGLITHMVVERPLLALIRPRAGRLSEAPASSK
jgi:exopolysaccharide production protein ExoZ